MCLVSVRYVASFFLVPVVVGVGGVVSSGAMMMMMIVRGAGLAGCCAAHDEEDGWMGLWYIGCDFFWKLCLVLWRSLVVFDFCIYSTGWMR